MLDPGEIKSREVEPGSERKPGQPFASVVPQQLCYGHCLCTAVETAISRVHKLLHTGQVPIANIVVLVVVLGLFGLLRVGACRQATLSPPTPSLLSHLASGDVKQHVYFLTYTKPRAKAL